MTSIDSSTTRGLAATSPAGPLTDAAGLVTAMKGVALRMAEDLVERSRDPRIEPSLRLSHQAARDAHETSDAYEIWRKGFCDQVAASWVLGAVFVRTLEDRGFLPHRLAGPGALDRFAQFRRLFRYLSERDYLLHIFDALAEPPPSWPAGRDATDWMGAQVFGRLSAPLWKLSPSQRALAELLDVLRSVDTAGALRFTFGRPDGVDHDGSTTRFLGDLYQDLNADVRKRYALLQTPDFVERFILDQTLTPGLQERGIAVTLCDPACGSGHFLLGAYDRLFEARQQQEPGRPRVEVARQALSQVYGVDLNPYAAAIARFRLLLSFLDKAGLTRLDQIPPGLHANIFIGDSLLAGRLTADRGTTQQFGFGDVVKDVGFAAGKGFSLVDAATEQLLKSTRFDVVVGNPPYITEKDAEKRELIRRAYPRSAAGKYALAAPFVERLFDLCNAGGWMGQITSNAFTKREFGKTLIEDYLRTVDLYEVVDTSGAYVPGHGTPTVLLFGRYQQPFGNAVQLVRGNRGEPSAPVNPVDGKVWGEIARHHQDVKFESAYISVGSVERGKLAFHPWSLGGGGAAEIKELIELRAEKRLGELVDSIGITAVTGEDDVFVRPKRCLRSIDQAYVRLLVEGDRVRDWSVGESEWTLFPYGADFARVPIEKIAGGLRYLWPYRAGISRRKRFGTPMLERGLTWYELQEVYAEKLRSPMAIFFASVAGHNHFVYNSSGGNVFKQSAPVIKLLDGATEDEYIGLTGYLNSSVACFWMKQVFYPKATSVKDVQGETGRPEDNRYDFAGTGMHQMPLPPSTKELVFLAREVLSLSAERSTLAPRIMDEPAATAEELRNRIRRTTEHQEQITARMIALQEEIDWRVYEAFGLSESLPSDLEETTKLVADLRPFQWNDPVPPMGAPKIYASRRVMIEQSADLRLLEDPNYKRLWKGQRGIFARNALSFRERVDVQIRTWLLDYVEGLFLSRGEPKVVNSLWLSREISSNPATMAALEILVGSPNFVIDAALGQLISAELAPSASSQLYSDDGIEKRRIWEETWTLQRREDAGEKLSVPVPPKYDKDDFEHSAVVWRHRGKLDVPKERFIAYPTATPPPGATGSAGLVFGWAGWTHIEQLQAAIALWQDEWDEHGTKVLPRATRATRDDTDPTVLADNATREKLLPILQTMVDLLPWVIQWHNEDGGAADFERYVKEECRKVEMSLEEVHLFRLAKKVKAPKAPKAPKTAAPAITEDAVLAAATALAGSDTVEASAIAEELGVAAAKLKAHFDALVERGALVQTKARPRTFRVA
jgi:hypothetical protein